MPERRKREFERREGEILSAALALSNRDDWQSVTIEQIADKAEIGKGTVYKHFASKDEIYARLALSFHRIVLERLSALEPAQPPEEALRAIVKVFWDAYTTNAQYQRVVDYSERPDFRRQVADETRRELDQVSSEITARIQSEVERGVEVGLLPNPAAAGDGPLTR